MKHEPGITQRADIGTKPFSKDRLDQLKDLWNIKDRRVRVTNNKMMNVKPWFHKLLLLCQVCDAQSVKENIQPEVPWDLYIVVVVMAIAVIGLWEAFKQVPTEVEGVRWGTGLLRSGDHLAMVSPSWWPRQLLPR